MNRMLTAMVMVMVTLVGCRTEIDQTVRNEPVRRGGSPQEGRECHVLDYPSATDIPDGAKSLGWVQVPRQETPELTFELLRKTICDLGGDAMTQMRWIRASGASVASPPVELEGNAWVLP